MAQVSNFIIISDLKTNKQTQSAVYMALWDKHMTAQL